MLHAILILQQTFHRFNQRNTSGSISWLRGVGGRRFVGFSSEIKYLECFLIAHSEVETCLQLVAGGTLLQFLHMDDTQFADVANELVVFPISNEEREFLHVLYHTATASFPSRETSCSSFFFLASCRDFRIFCEDLERFSSSSINRLILRIAS